MSDQSFSSLQAVGTKVVIYQMAAKHFQEKRESAIALPSEVTEKRLYEGVIVSVGNKANAILKQGQYVIFEKNAIRKLESTKIPNNIILVEDDMIYTILEGVTIPEEVKAILAYE